VLAFVGGIAIGLGISWLFCPQDPNSQAEPGALQCIAPHTGRVQGSRFYCSNEGLLHCADYPGVSQCDFCAQWRRLSGFASIAVRACGKAASGASRVPTFGMRSVTRFIARGVGIKRRPRLHEAVMCWFANRVRGLKPRLQRCGHRVVTRQAAIPHLLNYLTAAG